MDAEKNAGSPEKRKIDQQAWHQQRLGWNYKKRMCHVRVETIQPQVRSKVQ